jgi:hypothetical protein
MAISFNALKYEIASPRFRGGGNDSIGIRETSKALALGKGIEFSRKTVSISLDLLYIR